MMPKAGPRETPEVTVSEALEGTLWFDATGRRFFVTPAGWAAPPGGFDLVGLDGTSVATDEGALAAFEVDELVADRHIQAESARAVEVVGESIGQVVERVRDVAPGLPELLRQALSGSGGPTPESLATLVGLDPQAVHDDPARVAAELERLVGRLGGLVTELGLGPAAPANDAGEVPPASSLDDVAARADTLLGRVGAWLAKNHPDHEFGNVRSLQDLIGSMLGMAPEASARDTAARDRADARASVDAALADFRLPSFAFDDLLASARASETAESPKADEPDDEPTGAGS